MKKIWLLIVFTLLIQLPAWSQLTVNDLQVNKIVIKNGGLKNISSSLTYTKDLPVDTLIKYLKVVLVGQGAFPSLSANNVWIGSNAFTKSVIVGKSTSSGPALIQIQTPVNGDGGLSTNFLVTAGWTKTNAWVGDNNTGFSTDPNNTPVSGQFNLVNSFQPVIGRKYKIFIDRTNDLGSGIIEVRVGGTTTTNFVQAGQGNFIVFVATTNSQFQVNTVGTVAGPVIFSLQEMILTKPALTLFNSLGQANLEIRTSLDSNSTIVGHNAGTSLALDQYAQENTGTNNTIVGANAAVGIGSYNIVAVGDSALGIARNSIHTIAIGSSSGSRLLGSIDDTFIGIHTGGSGNSSTNIGIGPYAMANCINCSTNIAIGAYSMQLATGGLLNVAIGSGSLSSSINTQRNTVLGNNSLITLENGTLNIAIGDGAGNVNSVGSSLTTMNNNLYIGSYATGTNNSTNEIAIGSAANGNGSNTVTLGGAAITNTYLKGTVRAPGDIFYNGSVSLIGALAAIPLKANIASPTFTGTVVLPLTTIQGLTVGMGPGSGQAISNTIVGTRSAISNTTGHSSVVLGYEAYQANTTGTNNTAIGRGALTANTTGIYNTSLGSNSTPYNTTGNNNVGLGYASLLHNTTGKGNIGIGFFGATDLTTGDYNVMIGAQGTDVNGFLSTGITTGSYNTILGSNVSGLTATTSNNIILADGQGNRRINILANGNVGINNPNPTEAFHIGASNTNNSLRINGYSLSQNADIGAVKFYNSISTQFEVARIQSGVGTTSSSDGYLSFYTGKAGTITEKMRINENGYVGVGVITPLDPVHISLASQNIGSTTPSGALLISNPSSNVQNLELGVTASQGPYLQGRSAVSAATAPIALQLLGGNVGIGVAYPSQVLDVNGSASFGVAGSGLFTRAGSATPIRFFEYSSNNTNFYNLNQNGGFVFNSAITSTSLFKINQNGNVGVGIDTPTSKLQVNAGDIELGTVGTGVIIASPNGTRWRITISNTGSLTATSL